MNERFALLRVSRRRGSARGGGDCATEQQLGVYVSAGEAERLTKLAEELRAQLSAISAEWEELMRQLAGQARLSNW